MASLQDLYQANGFREVHVTSDVITDYQGHSDDLFVRFHIAEGHQTLVEALQLEGNKAISTDELMGVIGSTSGQPFSDFSVTADRDSVLALYYNRGFPDARFNATPEELPPNANGERLRVRLTYQIEEGQQLLVANILLDGYEHTRLSVIAREVQLQPGQPLSQETVVDTQRRLYNLGIFSRVSIAPQNPAGTDPNKNVGRAGGRSPTLYHRIRLGTRGAATRRRRLGAQAADQSTFSPRGTFEFTKLNLTGRADTLSFKARASTLQGRALLTYTSPNYFGVPKLSLQVSGFYDKTRDVLTFTSTRDGGLRAAHRPRLASSSIASATPTGTSWPAICKSARRRFRCSASRRRFRFSASPGCATAATTLADPTRGSFNTFDVDVAWRSFGSSASFVRVLRGELDLHAHRAAPGLRPFHAPRY